jgi:hypothetical protein
MAAFGSNGRLFTRLSHTVVEPCALFGPRCRKGILDRTDGVFNFASFNDGKQNEILTDRSNGNAQ